MSSEENIKARSADKTGKRSKLVQMAYNLYDSAGDAEAYNTYMVEHPTSLFTAINEFHGESSTDEFELAVDLGCGDGRSAYPLCKFFKKVVGIDISATCIKMAKSNTPAYYDVIFKVGEAEDLDFLEDSSVDLITIGLSIHWMDHERLNNTIRRVLKPGGSVAAYGFTKMKLDEKIANDYVNKLYIDRIIPLSGVPRERAILSSDYTNHLPYGIYTRRKELTTTKQYTVRGFVEFFKSVFAVNRKILTLYPNTTVFDEMHRKLNEFYKQSGGNSVSVAFTYFLVLSRKPNLL